MKRLLPGMGVLALATGMAMAAAPPERWLHVRVVERAGGDAETVRVNVPLSVAEKLLPAIQVNRFQKGRVKLDGCPMMDGVDVRAVLAAVRDAKDGEFVTVEGGGDNVRVAKEKGHVLVKVREGKGSNSKVDVRIPLEVVEALLSGGKNELDIAAAVRALGDHGQGALVTVNDDRSTVRVWIDSQNVSDERGAP